ncbi:MAG: hypothetical protein ACYC4K_06655 [Thiobacillus sp.]
MRLAELSPAERSYLCSPLPPVDAWTPLLIERLCHLLSARIKQRVQIFAVAPDPLLVEEAGEIPEISWDDQLDALWVRVRLGASTCIPTRCAALSRNLLHTLQQVLAETWRSPAPNKTLPHSQNFRIECTAKTGAVQHATLAIYFPATPSQMDRWAQRVNAA